MAAGSNLPPSVAGSIGLPRVVPTREFLAVMTRLWGNAFGPATTVNVQDATVSYDQAQVQSLVDAIQELQARHDGN